jgi:predicted PurR-regulated permease PerM
MSDPQESPTVVRRPGDVTGAGREPSAFSAPQWARDVGRWSWIVVGALLVLAALFWAAAAIEMVVLAALFAVLFGGTFLPVVDWLHKHRLPRWLGALLVLVFLIALAVFIVLVILYGLVKQLPVIQENLQAAADSINEKLASTSVDQSTLDSMKTAIEGVLKFATTGAAGTVASIASGLASLIFGVFISINILVWVLIQGRKIGAWASRHVPPVPQPVAYAIFANSARFFRGYIFGSTLIGLFNAAVIFLGALVIGVPMPGTLAIVAWMMNYIPFFGAIVSGAFAVLIAYGAGGLSMAIPMLIIVIIANGFLQTLVSQFALGSTLDLHPLVVLFATTAGGILFGAVGGVFAAPFVKIGLDAHARIKAAGVFGGGTPCTGEGDAPGASAAEAGRSCTARGGRGHRHLGGGPWACSQAETPSKTRRPHAGWGGRYAGTGACASASSSWPTWPAGSHWGSPCRASPSGSQCRAPRPRRCCSRWAPASSASSRSPSPSRSSWCSSARPRTRRASTSSTPRRRFGTGSASSRVCSCSPSPPPTARRSCLLPGVRRRRR